MMFDFLKKKGTEEAAETAAEGPECAACNQKGADKRFGGVWWHKKCLRRTRKAAKGMI